MIYPILGILLLAIVLWWDISDDVDKWERGVAINHFKEWVLRVILLIPSIVLLSMPQLTILKLVVSSGLVGFTFLLLFDGLYNVKRGFNWWFLGSIDKDESWFDNLQRKIPLPILKVLKISIPILLLLLYLEITW